MNWEAARERLRSPLFMPLRAAIDALPAGRWPGNDELTEAAKDARTVRGKPVRFVKPRERSDRERPYYEQHIAETGEVETREANWHDLFNALVWISFPRAKAAINAQHAAILEERGEQEAKRRSPERDALTLFDEGGIVVASSDARVFERIRAFAWKDLFWHDRAALAATTRFVAFGHNLFEKMLDPHLGIVAKTIFVPLCAPFDADAALAAHFSTRANFASPRAMAPMPVLGIPGWHPGTQTEVFYDDKDHFRGSRPR